jgi:hypothetical protein
MTTRDNELRAALRARRTTRTSDTSRLTAITQRLGLPAPTDRQQALADRLGWPDTTDTDPT